jgi:hypothetical protein
VASINAKRKGCDNENGQRSAGETRPRQAAVLLPLVNLSRADISSVQPGQHDKHDDVAVGGDETVPSILFQVRAGHMRMHAGEIR